MKPKILFLSPLPPPNYGSAMSSEMCLNILKKSNKFEIKNIKINFAPNIKDMGKLHLKKIKQILNKRREIKRIAKEFRPDLIYFMPATSNLGLYKDFIFIKTLKKFHKKILFHIRTHIEERERKNPIKKYIHKKILKNSKVIVLDELLIKDIADFSREKNIFVLPNAIKNNISDNTLKKVLKKRNKKRSFEILFISNMEESKGWLILLRACELLKKQKIKFHCSFIGGWPTEKQKEKFFDFVSKKNLNKEVKYCGIKTGREKFSFFENADVLVFPTYYKLEAHPRVILEAMMFALPIIANSHASIPNTIINKKTGFLLKENSPEEILEYVKILIKNKNKRIKMGVAGRKRFLQEYEIKNYSKKFIEIIEKSLKD